MAPATHEAPVTRALAAFHAALEMGSPRLVKQVAAVADLVMSLRPRSLLLTGTGKSGHVALAVAGTLRSIGWSAHFLPADELLHGDLGAVDSSSIVLFISRSGEGSTVETLLDVLAARRTPVVAFVGDAASRLARGAQYVVDVSVPGEGDAHGILPTTSTVLALSAGLALAVALMDADGVSPQDFLKHHPAGALGSRLTTSVDKAMHPRGAVPLVGPDDTIRHLVTVMTKHPIGLALVQGNDGQLIGVVSDGDLRRALLRFNDVLDQRVSQLMSVEPTVCAPTTLLAQALAAMERHRPIPISAIPVVEDNRAIGVITIHQLREVVR